MMDDSYLQYTGIAAGVLTSVSMLPQLLKTIRKKEGGEVSLLTLTLLISGLILWVVYGSIKDDLPIMLTNGFSVLLNLLLAYFSVKYARNKKGD